MGRVDRGQEEPAQGVTPLLRNEGAGGEVRTLTLEAESMVPGQRFWEACLVGVEVDISHAWLSPPQAGSGVTMA